MFRALTTLLLLLLVAAGCGKKGPVRPLGLPLPDAPGGLAARQVGMRLLLSWDLPTANQDGSPLRDLAGFRVYKMQYDPAEDCPDCRDTSVLFSVVDLDYLEGASRSGDRISLWDAELRPGAGYQYRVVPFNRKRREGAPSQLRRPFAVPPLAPAALSVAGHDRLVRAVWEPAGDGEEQLGYNLYRRQEGEPFPARPLNKAPLLDPFYDDYDVENGRRYHYAVRAVVRSGGETLESPLSMSAEAVPGEGR